MRLPQLAVGDLVDAAPGILVVEAGVPVGAEVTGVERGETRGEPGGGVDAVGDGADGDLFFLDLWPEEAPHGARDGAMQLAHAVVLRRESERQDGHAEALAPLDLLARELMKRLAVEAELRPEVGEVAVHQVEAEDVVAGGDGGMGGEDGVGGGDLARDLEGNVQPLDQLAAALQAEEGGVAFVHVPDRGVDAERAQGAHAADAKHDLLGDAHLVVAAVEARRERAVGGVVGVDVGVHQVERDAADLDAPDLGIDGAARQLDADADLAPVGVERGDGGGLREVELVVDGFLLAVAGDALAEVALGIEKADADEGQAEVAGLFAVVAGEDAQAAGVDGQRLVEAELGAEVGDGFVGGVGMGAG